MEIEINNILDTLSIDCRDELVQEFNNGLADIESNGYIDINDSAFQSYLKEFMENHTDDFQYDILKDTLCNYYNNDMDIIDEITECEVLEESELEKYWDATEIDRQFFKVLLKLNFQEDTYIVTHDGMEIDRFTANSEEEAKKIFRNEYLTESDYEPVEDHTFEEIIDRMEDAEIYEDLYNAAMCIANSKLQTRVTKAIQQCEEDGDDVDEAYSIVTSDILDMYRYDKNLENLDESKLVEENEVQDNNILKHLKELNVSSFEELRDEIEKLLEDEVINEEYEDFLDIISEQEDACEDYIRRRSEVTNTDWKDELGIESDYVLSAIQDLIQSISLEESKEVKEETADDNGYVNSYEIFNKAYSDGEYDYNFIINETLFNNWRPGRTKPKTYIIEKDGETTLITSVWQTWRKQIKDITGKDLKDLLESKEVITERKKRIARYNEFDNGHVFHSWYDWTEEEAEEKAKQASIDDPTNIYYVAIDDIMNPSTDLNWYQGKSYNSDEIQEIRKKLNEEKEEEVYEEENPQAYDYMLLDRLRMDCDYYLGNGNRHDKDLWAGNVDGQIAKMKELWNKLKEKPEWLTMEQIEDYAKRMGATELPSTTDGTAEKEIQDMLDRSEKRSKENLDENKEKEYSLNKLFEGKLVESSLSMEKIYNLMDEANNQFQIAGLVHAMGYVDGGVAGILQNQFNSMKKSGTELQDIKDKLLDTINANMIEDEKEKVVASKERKIESAIYGVIAENEDYKLMACPNCRYMIYDPDGAIIKTFNMKTPEMAVSNFKQFMKDQNKEEEPIEENNEIEQARQDSIEKGLCSESNIIWSNKYKYDKNKVTEGYQKYIKECEELENPITPLDEEEWELNFIETDSNNFNDQVNNELIATIIPLIADQCDKDTLILIGEIEDNDGILEGGEVINPNNLPALIDEYDEAEIGYNDDNELYINLNYQDRNDVMGLYTSDEDNLDITAQNINNLKPIEYKEV